MELKLNNLLNYNLWLTHCSKAKQMEGVFVGCDGNVIVMVAVVAITTRFNYNNIFATIICGVF